MTHPSLSEDWLANHPEFNPGMARIVAGAAAHRFRNLGFDDKQLQDAMRGAVLLSSSTLIRDTPLAPSVGSGAGRDRAVGDLFLKRRVVELGEFIEGAP